MLVPEASRTFRAYSYRRVSVQDRRSVYNVECYLAGLSRIDFTTNTHTNTATFYLRFHSGSNYYN